MRYSLCSYSLHRTVAAGQMDLFGYFRFCQEAGYTQLDPWNEHIKQAYDDNGFLAEVKAAAAETGLPMGCIAVDGAHIYEPTPEGRELNRARRYRWLEIAHELGAEQLRIDAGGRDQTLDEIFDVVVEGYKDIISRAQAQGVEIIIENHWGRPITLPPSTAYWRRRLGRGCSLIRTTGPRARTSKPGANASPMPG
ncbi:MAG: TIM barrel protein [Anaerolineales bacterium]|nr:TIM barrel protein [Anaerolineales bacterium]